MFFFVFVFLGGFSKEYFAMVERESTVSLYYNLKRNIFI